MNYLYLKFKKVERKEQIKYKINRNNEMKRAKQQNQCQQDSKTAQKYVKQFDSFL